jgi:hypothetical protein
LTTTVSKTEKNMTVAILPIDELKPHEKGSPLYLELLRREILRDGMLKYPIIADEKTHVILDGMHRWLALKSLGYASVPVMLVDTFQSGIHVGRRRIHRYVENSDEDFTVEQVISTGLSGRLMTPRSTRHFFPFSKFHQINCPLDLLGKGVPQDVSRYLAKMTRPECILAIEEWREEISEELQVLAERRREVEKEMEEFLNRTRNLDSSS